MPKATMGELDIDFLWMTEATITTPYMTVSNRHTNLRIRMRDISLLQWFERNDLKVHFVCAFQHGSGEQFQSPTSHEVDVIFRNHAAKLLDKVTPENEKHVVWRKGVARKRVNVSTRQSGKDIQSAESVYGVSKQRVQMFTD
jgi:hypothetical protein